MTIPFSLIPSFSSLMKCLVANVSSGDSWTGNKKGSKTIFFSRGMWALYEGIHLIRKQKKLDKVCLWVPDYFCNEVLSPLRISSISFYFYPVNRDFQPDWRNIENQFQSKNVPDATAVVCATGPATLS